MSELTATKILSAMIAALVMQWAYIPQETWLLGLMMLIDFLLGNAVAIQNQAWVPRTFGNGILRKLSAFLMLGALAIVKEPLGVQFDLVKYFTSAAIVYEFLSAGQSHIALHGPGWQWMDAFTTKVRAFLADRKSAITQDSISNTLDKQKKVGEDSRAVAP